MVVTGAPPAPSPEMPPPPPEVASSALVLPALDSGLGMAVASARKPAKSTGRANAGGAAATAVALLAELEFSPDCVLSVAASGVISWYSVRSVKRCATAIPTLRPASSPLPCRALLAQKNNISTNITCISIDMAQAGILPLRASESGNSCGLFTIKKVNEIERLRLIRGSAIGRRAS